MKVVIRIRYFLVGKATGRCEMCSIHLAQDDLHKQEGDVGTCRLTQKYHSII